MPARTFYLIKRIETEVTTEMNKALTPHNLTVSQFTVLNFVNTNIDDISSAQLSRRFNMTPQSMSEVVSILLRKKLIEKNVDTDNKRVQLISLTDTGKAVLKECNETIDGLENKFLSAFSDADLQQFRGLMGILLRGT